jgi:hypothetical protein
MLVDRIDHGVITGGFGNHSNPWGSLENRSDAHSGDHVSVGNHNASFGSRRAPTEWHISANIFWHFSPTYLSI